MRVPSAEVENRMVWPSFIGQEYRSGKPHDRINLAAKQMPRLRKTVRLSALAEEAARLIRSPMGRNFPRCPGSAASLNGRGTLIRIRKPRLGRLVRLIKSAGVLRSA